MRKSAFVLALLAAAVCGTCARRPARVAIGIALTTSTHTAVRMAVQEINAQGGIGGVRLDVAGYEWSGSLAEVGPGRLLDWARRFAATKDLVAVVGHSDSASTLSAAASYNKDRIPQLVTIATNPAITNIGEWTYRLCLSDAAQGPALADYAVNDWKKRRIGIVFVNDDYGRGLAQTFEQRARVLGADIVAVVGHRNVMEADDRETVRSALARMRGGNQPDLIALFQRPDAAAWTVQAMHDAGLVVDRLGGDSLAAPGFADQEVAQGIRVSEFLALDGRNAKAVDFARRYYAIAGSDPDYEQLFAYDAIYLLRDAVAEGGYRRAGVKSYLDALIRDRKPVHGVSGTFTLGPDHDARRALYVAEVRNRRFELVKELSMNDRWGTR